MLDSLLEENAPFGVEKKVLGHLWFFYKWEDSTLIQLYHAPVLNNNIRGFFSTLVLWQMFKTPFSEIGAQIWGKLTRNKNTLLSLKNKV